MQHEVNQDNIMKTYLQHLSQLLTSSLGWLVLLKTEGITISKESVGSAHVSYCFVFFKKHDTKRDIRDNELQVDIRYVLPYSIWDATREASRKRRDIYYCIWIIKTQDISQQRAQAVKDAACVNNVNA